MKLRMITTVAVAAFAAATLSACQQKVEETPAATGTAADASATAPAADGR